MNESSEVKALVRGANNLSGCSIKRKLQRRKSTHPLQHLDGNMWMLNLLRHDED